MSEGKDALLRIFGRISDKEYMDLHDAFTKLETALDSQWSGWIYVTERMPKERELFLGCFERSSIIRTVRGNEKGEWFDGVTGQWICGIDAIPYVLYAWRPIGPLPSPPKEPK